MEKKPLIIVKIGGSAITAKDDNRPEVNQKNLNRLASELSEAYQKALSCCMSYTEQAHSGMSPPINTTSTPD